MHDNGVSEPLVIDVSPDDFGTVVLGATMHEKVLNLDEVPDIDTESEIEEIRKLLDLEATDVPEYALATYQDKARQIIHAISQGSVQPRDLHELVELSEQLGIKYAAEVRLRADRQRVLGASAVAEKLQDMRGNLGASVVSAETVTLRLQQIANGLREMQNDRYGHEASYSVLRSYIQALDVELDGDRVIANRVRTSFDYN